MNIEKLTKDEYNYIIFESLIKALAAIEEILQECKINIEDLKRYYYIRRKLRKITYKILEMKEKDT